MQTLLQQMVRTENTTLQYYSLNLSLACFVCFHFGLLWFVVTEKRFVSNLQQDKFQQMSDQIITRNILLLHCYKLTDSTHTQLKVEIKIILFKLSPSLSVLRSSVQIFVIWLSTSSRMSAILTIFNSLLCSEGFIVHWPSNSIMYQSNPNFNIPTPPGI